MLNARQDKRISIYQTYFVFFPLFSKPILTRQIILSTKNSLWKSVKSFLPKNSIQNDNQQERRRERERQKSNSFRLVKQKLCTCITLFCTFFSRRSTTTTWKCLILCFVENGNPIQQLPISFPELWYSPLEFNSKKFQHLTNTLLKWRFRSRRRRCCLSSLILPGNDGLTVEFIGFIYIYI